MQRDPLAIEKDGKVCDIIMKRIGRPRNLIMCKASNLWDNRYRINVYTRHEKDGLEGQRITYSCFAKLTTKGELDIVHESNPLKA